MNAAELLFSSATDPYLDPILTGTIKTHLVRQAWDETVRVVASIQDRIVSASLILHRLGSLQGVEKGLAFSRYGVWLRSTS